MHRQKVLKLYKTILRLHKALPKEMKELGDQYVRDEFRRHKGIAPEHVAPFMMEWSTYCVTLAEQLGVRGPKTSKGQLGKPLELEDLDKFEVQQIVQLYELKQAIDGEPEGEEKSKTNPKDQT